MGVAVSGSEKDPAMSDILTGDVWCGHGDASFVRVQIVTARAGKRIRLRRLTGAKAGSEIMVEEDQLRSAFRYEMPWWLADEIEWAT